MIKEDVKSNYLSYQIERAIKAFNLTSNESVFAKSIDELKKAFPSCSKEELYKILNISLQIYNNKKTEKSKIVFTGPTSFDEMQELLIQKSLQGVYINLYLNDFEKHEDVLKRLIAYKTGNQFIRIYKYIQPKDDKMASLHAKMIVVDEYKSLISSANLSYHGMEGNIEVGIYMESEEKAREIEELLKNLKKLRVFEVVK